MFLYWLVFIMISDIMYGMCEPSSKHIARRKDVPKDNHSKQMENTWKERFFLRKRNMFDRVEDETPKQGSFKIDDGKVIGGGIYEFNKDGVNLDMKLRINPNLNINPPCVPASKPAATSEHPTAPSGSQGSLIAPSGVTASTTAGPTTGGAEGTPGTGGGVGSEYQQEALLLHNKFRKIHDAPAMTLNAEMSQAAASYAAKISKMGMNLQHSSREELNGDGENLSMGCSTNQGRTVNSAITGWYNEVCQYTFGSEGGSGHFTQLVWKTSVELGFGKADIDQDGMKCTYYVARYRPGGNMIGDYAANVLKGSFDPSYCKTVKQ